MQLARVITRGRELTAAVEAREAKQAGSSAWRVERLAMNAEALAI